MSLPRHSAVYEVLRKHFGQKRADEIVAAADAKVAAAVALRVGRVRAAALKAAGPERPQ